MLSSIAFSAVCGTLKLGCILKVFPYKWDSKEKRLKTPTSKTHFFFYKIQEFFTSLYLAFILFRLLQTIKDDIPSRVRIVHFTWTLLYTATLGCKYQFSVRREEIKFFANILLKQLKLEQQDKREETYEKIKADPWATVFVLITTSLMVVNPAAHAANAFPGPCSPKFLTSLVFECNSSLDMPMSFWERFPYAFLQFSIITITLTDVFITWTFNWAIVFLGLVWIKEKVKNLYGNTTEENDLMAESKFLDQAPEIYRDCQLLTIILNDAFRYYLQLFPSVLFVMTGVLLFGTIRYTHIEIHAYIVYPLCTMRCLFEAISALAAAGQLNQASHEFLKVWKRTKKDPTKVKYMTVIKTRELNCSAGSLYAFQNSIVLVSLNNCIQLTFNMLVSPEI